MRSHGEKDMLRDIMEDIFIPMYEHMELRYSQLESRVYEQMPHIPSTYVTWGTLMEHESLSGGHPYLFPVLDEDLQEPKISLSNITQRLRDEREVRIGSVFIEADYLICKKIADSRQIFEGNLHTDNGKNFRIGVRLHLSERYSACVRNLYRVFVSNGVPWQTLNFPYIFKMFDVMLTRISVGEDSVSGISSGYEADFEQYAGHIKNGLVPAWNIQKLRIKGDDFPLAAIDKINYEHVFELGEDGSVHGYLVDFESSDISNVRIQQNSLIVTSPMQKGLIWDMYKIIKRKDYITDYFRYEPMSNEQADSFAARMTTYYGTTIKTNAELHRLLESYDISKYVNFLSAQVVSGDVMGETYEVNDFLIDEIRDLSMNKSLLLRFSPLSRDSYILRDLISFLVSQVQLIYPEFHCVGVLV